jgi:ADP-heptose:LPS heptosyltransferase
MKMKNQEPLDATNEDKREEEIKVIAIKLPFDLQERLLTFPFLHLIRDLYPNAEIHFITPKWNIEVLNLLPFKAFYHEFEEDEIRTIFDVHRYTANSKIFNVDLFISLTNSFPDACIGLGLRAKKRVGFSDGWKAAVLNIKIKRPIGYHVSEDFIALYKELIGKNIDTKLKTISRELSPVIEEWDINPYIAINLSPLRDAIVGEELFELLNYFENQKIVLFASEEPEKVRLLMEPSLANLPKKNQYVYFFQKDLIDLSKMIAFARGVISYNGPIVSLSAYIGTRTIGLFDSEDPQKSGPLCFFADFLIMSTTDPTLIQSTHSNPILKERKKLKMDEVFARAYDFFRLKVK